METLLFTGASGFLGRNMLPVLEKEYSIETLGRSKGNSLVADLSAEVPEFAGYYDVVLHAAGKAHMVPLTQEEKDAFYANNVLAAQNLCSALEKSGLPKSFIFISSVSVYGDEGGLEIPEDAPLNGSSVYARNKIEAETFLAGWCRKHGVRLTILRPALIAGPNPPGNLGAMIRGIRSGRYLSICHGKTCKSVVMAEDVANAAMLAVDKGGIYNLCDSQQPSFGQLEAAVAAQLGKRPPVSIPYWGAKILALCGDLLGRRAPINSARLKKMTTTLTFSSAKAQRELGWKPLSVVDNFKIG